jgi:hypothetical protein
MDRQSSLGTCGSSGVQLETRRTTLVLPFISPELWLQGQANGAEGQNSGSEVAC